MAGPDFPSRIGTYVSSTVGGEAVRAYLPAALPPVPPVDLTALYPLLDLAMQSLGRLTAVTTLLPDTSLFLYLYVRKEALLSSQIEGTQSSLSDLLLFENEETPGVPINDVEEVSNYVAAMNHGLKRIREGFPLSLRLIREIHDVLLRGGRGANKQPGEFRRSQNWIGGTRPGNAIFVPPPPERLMECLDTFEKFLHDDNLRMPVLVRAALVHLQFETIHPFLDGNGRLGRLLVTLLLCAAGVLTEPLLYLSLFLKTHRDRYYELLQKVRIEGAWEEWLTFFLEGIDETARQAADAAARILVLFKEDRQRIAALGRGAASALRVHEHLQQRAMLTIPATAKVLGISQPTVSASVEHLIRLEILRETTGRQRGRVFVYDQYLKILEEGTEPLRPQPSA